MSHVRLQGIVALCYYHGMSTPKSPWLERRREAITGSDAAAILGHHPFRTPIEVWAEKVGMLSPQNLDSVERVRWGSILEAPIIREVLWRTRRQRLPSREWGSVIRDSHIETLDHVWTEGGRERSRPKHLVVSDRIKRAAVTPDFALREWRPMQVPGEQLALEGPGIGEIKTTSAWNARFWKVGPPVYVQLQAQHALMIENGPRWGMAAVFIGGQALRIFDFPAHGPAMRLLEDRIGHFWDKHVLAGIPPEPLGTEQERRALARIYPEDDGSLAVLPSDPYREHLLKATELRAKKARIEGELLARETKLKAAIGTASFAVIDGTGLGFSFKADARGARRIHRMKDNALVAPSRPARISSPEGKKAAS